MNAWTRTREGRSSRAPRSFAFRSVGTLRGTVIGRPRGTELRVQVRRGDAWRDVGRVRTGRGGAYRYAAGERGTYRVVTGGAAGRAVRIC